MSSPTLRVLLVDDSEAIRLTMSAVLEMMGHEVLLAESLAEARARQTIGAYDVAILDVHLGDEIGMDLIPELRRLQSRAVIVMFSGIAGAEQIEGADLVIDKGQDAELIVRRLEEAAAARPAV
jgi:DNA-binding response OmpR family regulator